MPVEKAQKDHSKSWLESRLSYRRLVFKMIKEIETHCEDVICTAQNSLNLTTDAFMKVCDSSAELSSGQQQLVDSKQEDIGEKIDPDEEEKKDTVSLMSSTSKRS